MTSLNLGPLRLDLRITVAQSLSRLLTHERCLTCMSSMVLAYFLCGATTAPNTLLHHWVLHVVNKG